MTAPLSPAVPSLGVAAVDTGTGRFLQPWVAFFRRFSAGAPPLQAVALGASPFAWAAPGPGDVLVSGGAGVTITLARGRVTLSVPPGFVPVAAGDVLTVGFTGTPALTFIPRTV